MVLDCDQWMVYGMFACLLADEDRPTAARMTVEAEGEGMETEFEEGETEMADWLRYQHRETLRSLNCRRRPVYYTGTWPLVLH